MLKVVVTCGTERPWEFWWENTTMGLESPSAAPCRKGWEVVPRNDSHNRSKGSLSQQGAPDDVGERGTEFPGTKLNQAADSNQQAAIIATPEASASPAEDPSHTEVSAGRQAKPQQGG